MAKEYPQLKIGHHLIDSAAMLMVKNPKALNGIVVTSNLFGDIISDEASIIPGSIGLLPSASLTGIPDGKGKCNGIYEPIHGTCFIIPLSLPIYHLFSQFRQRSLQFAMLTPRPRLAGSAPDISGKGIVNPIGTILSVAMMLKYSLNLPAESVAVEEAVRRTIDKGIRTMDIGGTSTTAQVGDAVADELAKVLKEL
jgi:3-isopropylmalate dehydrogenase